MADKKKYNIGALLVTVMLMIVYISFSNVQMRVDVDKSTFYTKLIDDNGDVYGRWTVSGREYNKLFDGTSIMYRDRAGIEVSTNINETSEEVWITRSTPYIRGPTIVDTYYFKGDINDVEQFPISHTIEIFNGSGYFYRYEVRDLFYDGPSLKLDTTSMEFGRNMKITWQDDYRWARVYQSGILKVQYDIPSDYVKFENRLFDPIAEQNWIIKNNSVYINDSKLYMSAEPYLTSGGEVNVELISKVFTGDANLVIGTDSDIMELTGFEIYKPHNVTVEKNYTCDYSFNYTINPNYFWCYIEYPANVSNGTPAWNHTIFEHTFDRGNITTKTAFWDETHEEDYIKKDIDKQKINYEFSGMDRWHLAKNIPIVEDVSYKGKFTFMVSPFYSGEDGKYWICVAPASYGRDIRAANQAGHLYCLDPWYNAQYDTKRFINCDNMDNGVPLVINGTGGFDINGDNQVVWTACQGSSTALYYDSTDSSNYIVANDSDTLPFEVEAGNGTSYNPTLVWGDYNAVQHLQSDGTDSSANGLDSTVTGASNIATLIGNGYEFDDASLEQIKADTPESTAGDFGLMTLFQLAPGAVYYDGIMGASSHHVYQGVDRQDFQLSAAADRTVGLHSEDGAGNYKGTTGSTLDGDSWYLGIINYDDSEGEFKLYLNNSLDITHTTTYDFSSTTWMQQAVIYYAGDYTRFEGILDETRFRTSMFSEDERTQIYNNILGTTGYGELGEVIVQNSSWQDDSYSNRFHINCTKVDAGVPIVINGSDGFYIDGNQQFVWTKCGGDYQYVYYNDETDYKVMDFVNNVAFDVEDGDETSLNPADVWDDYYAVYHMNNYSDATGNGYDIASAVGDPTQSSVNGKIDGSYDYDGNDYHVGSNNDWDGLGTAGMISFWVNQTDRAVVDTVLLYSAGDNYDYWGVYMYDYPRIIGRGATSSYDFGFWPTTETVSYGKHHMVLSQTGEVGGQSIWMDGVKVTDLTYLADQANLQTKWVSYVSATAYKPCIGALCRSADANFMKGNIDELRMATFVPTDATVNQTFQNAIGTEGYGSAGAVESLTITVTTNSATADFYEADGTADITGNCNATSDDDSDVAYYYRWYKNDANIVSGTNRDKYYWNTTSALGDVDAGYECVGTCSASESLDVMFDGILTGDFYYLTSTNDDIMFNFTIPDNTQGAYLLMQATIRSGSTNSIKCYDSDTSTWSSDIKYIDSSAKIYMEVPEACISGETVLQFDIYGDHDPYWEAWVEWVHTSFDSGSETALETPVYRENIARGDEIYFACQGAINPTGDWANSSTISVSNGAPTVSSVLATSSGSYESQTEDWTGTWTTSDPDDDKVWNTTWYNSSRKSLELMMSFDTYQTNDIGPYSHTAADSGYTWYHGLRFGDANVAEGYYGLGLNTTAISDYVTFEGSEDIHVNSDGFTVTMWINPQTFNDYHPIVTKVSGSGVYEHIFSLHGTRLKYYNPSSNWLDLGQDITGNTWQHVAYVINSTHIRTYLDGVAGTAQVYTGPASTSDLWGVGKPWGAPYRYDGVVDEVRLWNKDFTTAEINAEMNSRFPVTGEDIAISMSFEAYNSTHFMDSNDRGAGPDGSGALIVNSGGNQRINVDDAGTNFQYGFRDEFTWCADFKTPDTGVQGEVMQRRIGSWGTGFSMINNQDDIQCIIEDTLGAGVGVSSNALLDDTWYHACCVRDVINDELIVYVDGIDIRSATDPTTTDLYSAVDTLYIGDGGSDYDGSIDNVQIFNWALTPEQVVNVANHNAVLDSEETSRFDEWDLNVVSCDYIACTDITTDDFTITDNAPVASDVTIIAGSALNDTHDDWTLSWTQTDPDGDYVYNTTWFTASGKEALLITDFNNFSSTDLSGNDAVMTDIGYTGYDGLLDGPTLTNGYYGKGYYFDGIDDRINITPSNKNTTVMGWIKDVDNSWTHYTSTNNDLVYGSAGATYINGVAGDYYDNWENESIVASTDTNTTMAEQDPGAAYSNTYTPPIAANEGATHVLSFVATDAHISGIWVYVVAKGTDDWRATLHTAGNSVLAQSGNMATTPPGLNTNMTDDEWYFFPIYTYLVIGDTYHIHLEQDAADGTIKADSDDINDASYIIKYGNHTKSFTVIANGETIVLYTNTTERMLHGAIIDLDAETYNYAVTNSQSIGVVKGVHLDPITDGSYNYMMLHGAGQYDVRLGTAGEYLEYEVNTILPALGVKVTGPSGSTDRIYNINYSLDHETWYNIVNDTDLSSQIGYFNAQRQNVFWVRVNKISGSTNYFSSFRVQANIDVSGLPYNNDMGIRSGDLFKGYMDEVRIWDELLDTDEIAAEMASPYPVKGDNLVSSYSYEHYNSTHTMDTNHRVAGYYGGGQHFDGVGDYIDTGSAIFDTTSDWTYSLWIKPNILPSEAPDDMDVISLSSTDSIEALQLETNNDKYESYWTGTPGSANSDIDVLAHEWSFVSLRYDSSETTLYWLVYDSAGKHTDSNSIDLTAATTVNTFRLGAHRDTKYFNGTIDDVRIYNYTLSEEQLVNIYSNNSNILDSEETEPWETWTYHSILSDNTNYYSTEATSTFTILNEIPTVTSLEITGDANNDTNTDWTASWTQSDDNGEDLYNTSWWIAAGKGPVLVMPFNTEAATDLSAEANTFTTTDVTYTTNGYIGGAYTFKGLGGGDSQIQTTGFDYPLNVTTISMWIKPLVCTQNERIIEKGANNDITIMFNDGSCVMRVRFYGTDDNNLDVPSATFNEGDWNHVVFRYSGSKTSVWINGAEAASETNSGTVADNSDTLTIGDYGGGGAFSFNGTIDEVYIFNYSLSDEQIVNIYNNQSHILDSEETTPGDTWTVHVYAADGINYSTEATDSMTVNDGPDAQTARISPVNPSNVEDLIGWCNATDVDGDDINYSYKWYKDGVLYYYGDTTTGYTEGVEVNVNNLSYIHTTVGETWTLGCKGYDIAVSSLWVNSSGVDISELDIEGYNRNVGVELGSILTLDATFNDTVCIDFDHYKYGVNYSCGGTTTSFDANVTDFRNTGFEYFNKYREVYFNFSDSDYDSSQSIITDKWNDNDGTNDNYNFNPGTVTNANYLPNTSFFGDGAYSFDGAGNNWLNMGNDSSLGTGDITFSGGFTGCTWFNTSTGTVLQSLFSRYWSNYELNLDAALGFYFSGTFGGSQADERSISSIYSINEWVYVCVTLDNTNLIYYVNGIAVDTDITTGNINITQSNRDFEIGRRSGGGLYFNGSIGNTLIWNRALTPTEVNASMTNSSPVVCNGLVASYEFEDYSNSTFTPDTNQICGGIHYAGDGTTSLDTGQYLNGVDNYVNITAGDFMTDTVGAWSFWTKPSDCAGGGEERVIDVTDMSEGSAYSYIADNGFCKITIRLRSGAVDTVYATTTDTVLTAGEWSHIVYQQTGSGIELYLNGVRIPNADLTVNGGSLSTTEWTEYVSNADGATLGNWLKDGYSGSFYEGSIDEVMIFSTSLTAAQISDLYNYNSETTNRTPLASYTAKNLTIWGADLDIGSRNVHNETIYLSQHSYDRIDNVTFNLTGYTGPGLYHQDAESAVSVTGDGCDVGNPCTQGYDENWATYAEVKRESSGSITTYFYENFTILDTDRVYDMGTITIKIGCDATAGMGGATSFTTYCKDGTGPSDWTSISYLSRSISASYCNVYSPIYELTYPLPQDCIWLNDDNTSADVETLTYVGASYSAAPGEAVMARYYEKNVSLVTQGVTGTTYPKDVEVYLDGTLVKDYTGQAIGGSAELTDFGDGTNESENIFSRAGTNTVNLQIDTTTSAATFNITGAMWHDDFTIYNKYADDYEVTSTAGSWSSEANAFDGDTGTYATSSSATIMTYFESNNTLPYTKSEVGKIFYRFKAWRAGSSSNSMGVEFYLYNYDTDAYTYFPDCDASTNTVYSSYVFVCSIDGNDFVDGIDGVEDYIGDDNQTAFKTYLYTTPSAVTGEKRVYEAYTTYYRKYYPTGASIEIGTPDAVYEWNYTGAFSGTETIADFTAVLDTYYASECGTGVCTVPMYVNNPTSGILTLDTLSITQDAWDDNPVEIDKSYIESYLSDQDPLRIHDIPFTFVSSKMGTLQVDDMKVIYAGGNKTFEVLAHTPDYGHNLSYNVTYYYSYWNYSLPSNIEYMDFFPPRPTSKEVEPFGQDGANGIFTIDPDIYGESTFDFYIRGNETHECVNLSMSNESSYASGTQLPNYEGYDYQVAYYNFSDYIAYQGKVPDDWSDYDLTYTGTTRDGTLTGVEPTDGYFGGGYEFTTNDDDKITIGALGMNGESDITACAWAYSDQTQAQYTTIVGGASDGEWTLNLRNGANGLSWCAGGAPAYCTSTYTIPNGAWHYYCGTYNGSYINLYVDGVLNTGKANAGGAMTVSNGFIGSYSGGGSRSWDGVIDEVRVWNAVLTTTEIATEMDSEKPVRGEDLVASYSMNLADNTATYTFDTHYVINNSELGGYAFNFNGVDECLDGDGSWFDSNQGTISVWVKKHSTGTQYVWNLVESGSDRLQLYMGSTEALLNYYDGTSYIAQKTIPAGIDDWHLYTSTWNSTTLSLYYDGEFADSVEADMSSMVPTEWKLGSYNCGSNWFDGAIGRLMVYNYTLESDEIEFIYNNQRATTEADDWYKVKDDDPVATNFDIWSWADFGCDYTTWQYWYPDIYMKACGSNTDVCDPETQ